jgi:hypothetical protein
MCEIFFGQKASYTLAPPEMFELLDLTPTDHKPNSAFC